MYHIIPIINGIHYSEIFWMATAAARKSRVYTISLPPELAQKA